MRPHQRSERLESRSVNNLLHILRGEQFRHSQNVQRSRSHISSTLTRNSPTLRVNHFTPGYDVLDPESVTAEVGQSSSPFRNYSGPRPPKSWRLTSKVNVHATSTWRAHALGLILGYRGSNLPAVPPLTQLCLQILASFSSSEFTEGVVPFLPSHLCCDLIRYAAIHAPLPPSKLYPMYSQEGHANGELLIVGPQATLRDDFFIRDNNKSDGSSSQDLSDWDSESPMPPSLCTFILMSAPMSISVVLSLPPTITHMALLNLPAPIALHRLPGICPLLEILDLSYNTWLNSTSRDALARVEWSRWNCLRVLGLRECFVTCEMLQKLNKGRWDDVQVVGGDTESISGNDPCMLYIKK